MCRKKQPGTSKIVRQSNHDGGRVPDELSEYADKPLYILIALWCCRQKSWVGRKQISAAFAITERRASFQISYILRKTAIVRIQARKTKAEGSRHRCHEIFIEHVFLLPEKQEDITSATPLADVASPKPDALATELKMSGQA
ncbi:CaiF/GrlA family transcriptional regulator [Erwinia aphidicola]|uniref:CaiF/GrlA family transcriptional regulator n=1 Tax=Erwinia aphidicola TaxID=68334 RepID=UPI0030D42E0B